ncbi:MAG: hypothetical protein C0601_05130 [Candidatus Muiribacterium halophilum]|uniref:Uncharacterized protein n=1 Tax=Muiribacterium halophilum TaxID=2053465 RepID=A0A2N5ZIG3_MUIH1|nr:MAG: hypothetical protein C0601_05130 [Candidatus Muirbacterium halophilum]
MASSMICRKCKGKGFLKTGPEDGDWKTCDVCQGKGVIGVNKKNKLLLLFWFFLPALIIFILWIYSIV